MTVDRLRQAAQELDAWAATEGDWMNGESSTSLHWQREGALLRAIANDRDCVERTPIEVVNAALALADLILGDD